MDKKREKEVREVLENFVDTFLSHLDCDGGTRFVSAMMDKMEIEHTICTGAVTGKDGTSFPLHYWIESKNNLIWDFKCEKWVGSKMEDCRYMKLEDLNKNEFMLSHLLDKATLLSALLIGNEGVTVIATK